MYRHTVKLFILFAFVTDELSEAIKNIMCIVNRDAINKTIT